jgi:hypothetical protein
MNILLFSSAPVLVLFMAPKITRALISYEPLISSRQFGFVTSKSFMTSNFWRGIFDSDENCRQRMNQFGHYYAVYLSSRERIICRRQLYHYLYIVYFIWLELKRVDMHMCDGWFQLLLACYFSFSWVLRFNCAVLNNSTGNWLKRATGTERKRFDCRKMVRM